MAGALRNENKDLVLQNSKYVVQMTSGSEGVEQLENFMTADGPYPVLVTTSKLLTTGVDADTVKFIVLDSNINSMTEFKPCILRSYRFR